MEEMRRDYFARIGYRCGVPYHGWLLGKMKMQTTGRAFSAPLSWPSELGKHNIDCGGECVPTCALSMECRNLQVSSASIPKHQLVRPQRNSEHRLLRMLLMGQPLAAKAFGSTFKGPFSIELSVRGPHPWIELGYMQQ